MAAGDAANGKCMSIAPLAVREDIDREDVADASDSQNEVSGIVAPSLHAQNAEPFHLMLDWMLHRKRGRDEGSWSLGHIDFLYGVPWDGCRSSKNFLHNRHRALHGNYGLRDLV